MFFPVAGLIDVISIIICLKKSLKNNQPISFTSIGDESANSSTGED
jgi:hypothetical protein